MYSTHQALERYHQKRLFYLKRGYLSLNDLTEFQIVTRSALRELGLIAAKENLSEESIERDLITKRGREFFLIKGEDLIVAKPHSLPRLLQLICQR